MTGFTFVQGSVWRCDLGEIEHPVVVIGDGQISAPLPFVTAAVVRPRNWPVDRLGRPMLGEVTLTQGERFGTSDGNGWAVNCDLIFSIPKVHLLACLGTIDRAELIAVKQQIAMLLALDTPKGTSSIRHRGLLST